MLKILTFGRGKHLNSHTTIYFKVTFFVFEVLQYAFHHVQSFAFYLKPALLNRFSFAGLRLPPSFIRLYNSTARNFSQRKRCFHSSHVLIAYSLRLFSSIEIIWSGGYRDEVLFYPYTPVSHRQSLSHFVFLSLSFLLEVIVAQFIWL